jgi:uridine kinase
MTGRPTGVAASLVALRERPAFVVAVSGTSGAGKSTLIARTASRLGGAAHLHFDDYIVLGNDIEEITIWLDGGGNPDWLATPRLVADLRRLMTGNAVIRPNGARGVQPAPVIIVEEPFGRSRAEMAPLIDLAVHLEVPPEVALARRVLREIQAHAGSGSGGHAEWLAGTAGQLQAFLAVGRDAYRAAERSAREVADLVLDGLRPTDELAEQVIAQIASRR